MRTLPIRHRTLIAAPLAGAFGFCPIGAGAFAQPKAADDPWPSLSGQIFGGRPIRMDNGVIAIEAPYRAEDAAVVPVTLRRLMSAPGAPDITSVTLVIDENPSPLAAKFVLGQTRGIGMISTRVRVDSYTNIHAVAELADGSLSGSVRFVKAAGGCSAPAAKQAAGEIPAGAMRFRQFPPLDGQRQAEAELLIRHPNFTGMQMDQITRLYVPADFVVSVRIWQGDDLLMAVDSGISIAENPAFRFDYQPRGATDFHAEVKDSEGRVFTSRWPLAPV